MAQPDFKTFDLVEALSGQAYPEKDIQVSLDSKTAAEIAVTNRKLDTLDPDSEEFKALEDKLVELIKKLRSEMYTLTIKGVPNEVRRNILLNVYGELENIPESKRTQVQTYEAEEKVTFKTWAAHIVKITNPDGAVRTSLTDKEAERLFNALPGFSRNLVIETINEMEEITTAGFEIAITDLDFLSEASPEGTVSDTSQP